jgi:mono/diheme cytochrome c family protein
MLWKEKENYIDANAEFDNLIMEAMQKADGENLKKLTDAFPEIYARMSEGGGDIAAAPVPKTIKTEPEAKPELNYEKLTDTASLDAGKEIFMTNCASCHGPEGQGGIGPNMTDNYYIHGGGINDLMSTIIKGVPVKGMISWKGILDDKQINEVASYMMSLRGTNPPNPKASQGELVEFPEDEKN